MNMILKTEIERDTQTALIVTETQSLFVERLSSTLEQKGMSVVMKSDLPHDHASFDLIFFFDFVYILPTEFKKNTQRKIVYIILKDMNQSKLFSSFVYDHDLSHIKIVNYEPSIRHLEEDIDTILWFVFSRSQDNFLHMYHHETIRKKRIKPRDSKSLLSRIREPKMLLRIGVLFLLLGHLLFVPPLLVSTYFHYSAAKKLADDQSPRPEARYADISFSISQELYSYVRPIYHFFSIAFPVDDAMQMNESARVTFLTIEALEKDSAIFFEGLMNTQKTPAEYREMMRAKKSLTENTEILHKNVQILTQKLPSFTQEFKKTKGILEKATRGLKLATELEPYMDEFFAKDSEKKYLLMFANNMELRPGGGFIGSFAILTIRDYTIRDLQFYDVYDADGQLEEQIDPPRPILVFLNQTHWFLRDSAFSGDFVENFRQAETFLDKELGEKRFDGGILITTTAIKTILRSFTPLYIPDYGESITPENFYIKAQLYAEDDFFPGSKEKKSFLSHVASQMLFGLSDASLPLFFESLETTLDQKQTVMYAKNSDLQALFEKNYWSGRILTPKCSVSDALHCIPDYIFPLDANLGVNKANYFTSSPMSLHVTVLEDGSITNTYAVSYKNNSYPGIFPGGTYKNYFQLMIPPNSQIEEITVGDEPLDDFDETNFTYKSVGFLVTVEPQDEQKIEVKYRLPTTIVKGSGIYQLILQKQIGSQNSDFSFTFSYPKSMTIERHNLSPLAKDNEIIYNTSISSDKIFLIEFDKK